MGGVDWVGGTGEAGGVGGVGGAGGVDWVDWVGDYLSRYAAKNREKC